MPKSESNVVITETDTMKKGPSKMAEMIALHRVAESLLPKGRRIFYDPYAVHFVDPKVLEGLIMYIPAGAVDETLSFIAGYSGKGSRIIFDYYPQSLVDGTSNLETAANIRKYAAEQGEPLLFGIKEDDVGVFLAERGFSHICNITSQDYRQAIFMGANKDRPVSSLLYFAHATVE